MKATCTMTINGRTININNARDGAIIGVVNGNVMMDGEAIYMADQKVVNIQIHGNVERLEVDVCHQVSITGNADDVQTQSGDVTCGNVSGSVKTMSGDITGVRR